MNHGTGSSQHQPVPAVAPDDIDESRHQPPGSKPKSASSPARLFAGLRVVSLLTLMSRVLGMARDIAMASLFGNGLLMDAFTVAFKVPNLARRLFGEGALSAVFLPRFVRENEQAGLDSAWDLSTALIVWMIRSLTAVVVVAELALLGVWWYFAPGPDGTLLIILTAIMLPYLVFICVAAQMGAVLNSLNHFAIPAFLPVLLNTIWIAAICIVALLTESATARIVLISITITLAGILQMLVLIPVLKGFGYRLSAGWRGYRGRISDVLRDMLPVIVGLSVTQINTLSDSLIAWFFAAPEGGTEAAATGWHPLTVGTASALYYGQRLYQFPLGIVGVSLATVLFPLLARHAETGRFDRLRDDFALGVRLVIYVGLPASLGLMLLAHPLTVLLFERGAFDARDSAQTAAMISAYGIAVWAYCGLLVINRGYYAVGDQKTPMRIALAAVVVNLALNFTLIGPLGGSGLALATSITAMLQMVVLCWFLQHRIGRLAWRPLLGDAVKAIIATAVMSAVCIIVSRQFTGGESFTTRSIALGIPMLASIATYFAMAWLLRMDDLWLVVGKERGGDGDL